MDPAPIDMATFAELRDAVGDEFAVELVDTFLEEAPVMLAELRTALAASDADAYRRAAHSLKSNANTFGALALAGMARDVELGRFGAGEAAAAASLDALDAIDAAYAAAAAALNVLARG